MISIILLLFEILLDFAGVATAIIILVNFTREKLTRVWGVLALLLSGLLLVDNIQWIYPLLRNATIPLYIAQPLDHLSLWHIFRVVIFLQFYSFFPIAFCRPGWLDISKIISLSIPALVISCIAICYHYFGNHYTHLASFGGIIDNIFEKDVVVRGILFIFSIISPCLNFFVLFMLGRGSCKWHENRGMRFFMISFVAIILAYCWLMLGTSPASFHVFGCTVISFVLYMNILHLRGLEPFFPIYPTLIDDIQGRKDSEVSPVIIELSDMLKSLMKNKAPFTNPNYSLQDLLNDLNTNENRLNKALHYIGYSGFRDYINYERVQYFKQAAFTAQDKTVKELLYESGFTSRSSFYRHFSNIEKISPMQYIENIKTNSVT